MLNLVVAVLLINYDDQQAKDRARVRPAAPPGHLPAPDLLPHQRLFVLQMAAEAEADAAENGATSAGGGEKCVPSPSCAQATGDATLTRCCRCLPFRYAVSEEDKAAKLPPLEGKKPSAGESVRCPPLPNCLPCVAAHLRNTDRGLF